MQLKWALVMIFLGGGALHAQEAPDRGIPCAESYEPVREAIFPKNPLEDGVPIAYVFQVVIRISPSWNPDQEFRIFGDRSGRLLIRHRTLPDLTTSLWYSTIEIGEREGTCDPERILQRIKVQDNNFSVPPESKVAALIKKLRDIPLKMEMKGTYVVCDGEKYEIWFESSFEQFYWKMNGPDRNPWIQWADKFRKAVSDEEKSSSRRSAPNS